MTTKPKARKYRIRRDQASGAGEDGHETGQLSPAERIRRALGQHEPETQVGEELEAIKREGLTGRQLRVARRLAQKHKLPATSDYDAVRLLRQKGIDPTSRTNVLDLVVTQTQSDDEQPRDRIQLPQTIRERRETLPSTELSPSQRREMEIGKIQRDIARRRRRKMFGLMARLAMFVILPTALVGTYFYRYATPMYSTKSEFVILQADGALGSVGSLFAGTQFATSQDSISVQSFLESKEAMLLLDRDVGFKSQFQQPWIDEIQRLPGDASNEAAYKIYKRSVKLGYDPTEGVIRMEVIAPDPLVATEYSEKLISYAEERVNDLSEQKREDQMKDARDSFEMAQAERRNAQEALVQLQQEGAILDPASVIASLRARIDQVEVQLQDKELELAALLDNARPNKAKVDGAQADIQRLEAVLASLNAEMLDASNGENSLAQLNVRIQMAQADLASRDLILQTALQQMETTRIEANRQVRYLTVFVNPVPSDDPSYPRKFENTILAFLVFAGIYLMISLTASILREQVSS